MRLKNNHLWIFIIFTLGWTLMSCQSDQSGSDDRGVQSTEAFQGDSEPQLPEDFLVFYDKFHTDETFQLDHIIWPLRGLPDQVDSTLAQQDNFFFQKKDWIMHHKLNDPDNLFNQYFAIVDPKLIIEKIEMKTTNLSMERRFAKLNEEWNLIYYAGMNPMKR